MKLEAFMNSFAGPLASWWHKQFHGSCRELVAHVVFVGPLQRWRHLHLHVKRLRGPLRAGGTVSRVRWWRNVSWVSA